MSRKFVALAGALILAAGLAGCGKVGQLERPGPMFGHGRADEQPAGQARAKPGEDPNRPVETVDPRDRDSGTPVLQPAPGATPPSQ